MTEHGPCCDAAELPNGPWGRGGGRHRRNQVVFSERGGGFAHRPLHIHCHDQRSLDIALGYLDGLGMRNVEIERESESGEIDSGQYSHEPIDGTDYEGADHEHLVTLGDGPTVDVEFFVDELLDLGASCELNYVLFNDAGQSPSDGMCGCACGCAGSPIYGSPIYGSTYKSEGMRSNSARPVAKPEFATFTLPTTTPVRAIVLDTGIAAEKWRPALLAGLPRVCGDDPPDNDGDQRLDPASGHGTFVAGVIAQLATGLDLWVRRVLSSFGDGDIATEIVPMLYCLLREGVLGPDTVLNLSFGGYADREMKSLARAIRRVQRTGAVVVASAGNDATCRPAYPACLPGVVGVGALDDNGPAPYSNHGPWVRACAPGTDLVSAFYDGTTNKLPVLDLPVPPLPGSGEPVVYEGWARWTGTSFAAPVVTAALVRHMAMTGSTAKGAVAAVIDAPGLFRIPGLGTVVNLITPTPDEP